MKKPSTMEIFHLFIQSGLINGLEITFDDLGREVARYDEMRADTENFMEFYRYDLDRDKEIRLVAYVSMVRLNNYSDTWLMQQHCSIKKGQGIGVISDLYETVKDLPNKVKFMFGPFFPDNPGPYHIWGAAVSVIDNPDHASIADYRLSKDGKRIILIEENHLHMNAYILAKIDCINPLFTKPNGARKPLKGVMIKHSELVKERFQALLS